MNDWTLPGAIFIGIVAGLRAMTAPAAVSWAAWLGWIAVGQSPVAFLALRFTPWIFSALALVEFVTDQLPSTPNRTVPVQFGARLVSGALSGAALGAAGDGLTSGIVGGLVGAVIGTLGGRAVRARLAAMFGRDRPAALIEDAVAIGAAWLVVRAAA